MGMILLRRRNRPICCLFVLAIFSMTIYFGIFSNRVDDFSRLTADMKLKPFAPIMKDSERAVMATTVRQLTGPVSTKMTTGIELTLKHFTPIMTDSERAVLATTVRLLTDTLDAANITYHMCSGTLLGSYRHHGMIPWDDDVDLYVSDSDLDRVESAIRRQISADFVLVNTVPVWKIFWRNIHAWKIYLRKLSTPIKDRSLNYPYVELAPIFENTTHIWDVQSLTFARSTVYPLQRRPFMNMSSVGAERRGDLP